MSVKTVAERRERTLFLVETAMLTAIIIIMAFTPLGFLKSGVVEITFLAVPVAVGAVMMGWKGGLILGTVFGLVSSVLRHECARCLPHGNKPFSDLCRLRYTENVDGISDRTHF